MKNVLSLIASVACLAGISLALTPAAAQEAAKMDLATHTALIEKIENLLPRVNENEAQAQVLRVRLADLYAERARLQEFAAHDGQCADCEKGAKADRKKAITYYETSRRQADQDTLKKLELQLAHLYSLEGRSRDSEKVYRRVLNNRHMRDAHAKAHVGLGDLAFYKGDYANAKKSYQQAKKVLPKDATTSDRTYISFRLAWCDLNLGENASALRHIQSAVALARDQGELALQRDLIRDYATILARNPFNAKDVNTYIAHSPEADRAENLKFLGDEAERLGNKKGALLIWTQYSRQDDKADEESAEIQMKLAQNYYDLNDVGATLQRLDGVVKAVGRNKCEDCAKVKQQFRQLLVTWNKKEKTAPSTALVLAYGKYLEMQPDDFEALVWAAQVAHLRQDLAVAYEHYLRAARLATTQKRGAAEVERISLLAIEIAESMQDKKRHEQALLQYLDLNPQGSKRDLVEYQLADLALQRGEYARAARSFKELALRRSWKDESLRRQAANLSLDALTHDKRENDVRDWAAQYAREFKKEAVHFSEIGRKVTVNKVVRLVREKDATSELKSELRLLAAYNINIIPDQERPKHLRTLIIAAEKTNDLTTVENASHQLLRLQKLKPADRDLAQKSLLWVYELRLEFDRAYQLARQMPFRDLRRDERELRLGLLAELANKNPRDHFEKYVKWTSSVRGANQVRLKLIRLDRNQWRALENNLGKLRRTPDLLAAITLELHLNKRNDRVVKRVLATRGVTSTAEGRYLRQLQQREDFYALAKRVRAHKLQSRNDRQLQKSIRERGNLLEKLNQQLSLASRRGDVTLQVLALNTIAQEQRRFHRQLTSLPTPKGLRKSERALYRQLLDEKSRPFLLAADQADQRLKTFFSENEKALHELRQAIQSEDPLQHAMARNEYFVLRPYLPASERRVIDNLLAQRKVNPQKVAAVRREIKKNPFDPATLEDLREIEAKRANGPLLAVIDERLAQLKADARR